MPFTGPLSSRSLVELCLLAEVGKKILRLPSRVLSRILNLVGVEEGLLTRGGCRRGMCPSHIKHGS